MKKPFQRIAALTLSAALAIGCCGGALAVDADENDTNIPAISAGEDDYDAAHTITGFHIDSTELSSTGHTLEQFIYEVTVKARLVEVDLADGTTRRMLLSWHADPDDADLYLAGKTKEISFIGAVDDQSYTVLSPIPTITLTASEFYNPDMKYVTLYDVIENNFIFDGTATTEEAAQKILPKTAEVTLTNGKTEQIDISWKLLQTLEKRRTFELVLPDGYEPASTSAELPLIYIYGCDENKVIVDPAETVDFNWTFDGNSVEELTAALTKALPSIKFLMHDGSSASVPVTWTPDERDVADYLNGTTKAINYYCNIPSDYDFYYNENPIGSICVHATHFYVAPADTEKPGTTPATPATPGASSGTTGDAATSGTTTVIADSTTTKADATAKTGAAKTTSQTKSPKTADESHALLAVSALALSAAALTCAAVVTKKRKDA